MPWIIETRRQRRWVPVKNAHGEVRAFVSYSAAERVRDTLTKPPETRLMRVREVRE